MCVTVAQKTFKRNCYLLNTVEAIQNSLNIITCVTCPSCAWTLSRKHTRISRASVLKNAIRYVMKHDRVTRTKDTWEEFCSKQLLWIAPHFSDGRNSRINRVTDHKQKRACGPAPIILDCIIASSDARIASPAILFPLGIVVFRPGGAFSAEFQKGN